MLEKPSSEKNRAIVKSYDWKTNRRAPNNESRKRAKSCWKVFLPAAQTLLQSQERPRLNGADHECLKGLGNYVGFCVESEKVRKKGAEQLCPRVIRVGGSHMPTRTSGKCVEALNR